MSRRIQKPKIKSGSSLVEPIGQKNIFGKKIPKNKRYENVKRKTDSGMNVLKLKKDTNLRFRRGEKFKRIKRFDLARMISDEDTLAFVIVLDLRNEEEFEKCHVNEAVNYPVRFLSRSTNEFSVIPQIYSFRNDEKKLIVVYDYNEEMGIRSANTFFEKGFDNVVLLSGGLRRFSEKYDSLLFGKPPTPPKEKKKKKKKKTRRNKGDTVSVASYATTATNKKSSKFDKKAHHWK